MDRQCSSCGGICKKSGCERENVKPEQEPAWIKTRKITYMNFTEPQQQPEPNPEHNLKDVRCGCCGYMTFHREHMGCIRSALQREWVGLTDAEIDSALGVYDSFGGRLDARKIEAKLKEKNCE